MEFLQIFVLKMVKAYRCHLKKNRYRWNKKCRARVYTIGDIITPLQKLHTHEDIIYRKKRVAKKNATNPEKMYDVVVDYLLVSDDKKETSDDEDVNYVNYDN